METFNSFGLTNEQKTAYVEVVKSFSDFCEPKKNEVYGAFVFQSRYQKPDEPFDNFYMGLKKLVSNCGYGAQQERMLRDRIVMGVHDKKLQKRLLEMDNLNIAKAVDMARAAEITQK